jgi:hypothetical protein
MKNLCHAVIFLILISCWAQTAAKEMACNHDHSLNESYQPHGPERISVSWIPVVAHAGAPGSQPPVSLPEGKVSADAFLASLKGSVRPAVCQYQGSVLTGISGFTGADLRIGNNLWNCNLQALPVHGDDDAIDIQISISLLEGYAESAGIALAFDFSDWNTGNYLLIPAAVYNGNRNRIVSREYASGLDRTDLYRKDLPLTTAELPQLMPGTGGISRIEVNASNVTTPAVCFYDKIRKRGFILLAEQGVVLGDTIADNVFIVEESQDRTKMTLAVNAPGVREWKPEFIGFSKSPDRAIAWAEGDQLTLRLRMYNFSAEDIPEILDRFTSVRKSVTGNNQPRNLMPFSEILRVMTGNIDERFYEGDSFRFYCPENANWISFGWIGGLMNTFPMIALNNETHLERAASTFDFAIPRAQGASGFFYGALNFDGKCFGREGYDEHPEITLTRKNADVLLWMMKQFRLLEAQKREKHIKSEWEYNIRRLATAFVETWKLNGQWGNMINSINGDIAVFNTTSGASAIGGLAMASAWYGIPEYLDVALEAAEYYYYRDFLQLGMTTGCCADILQNADSETAAALMTSLMTLYEVTHDRQWLEKSRNVANLLATWIVSHDYRLPPNTELAKLGARLTGTVWASTQNKHGAPGFCTSSGDPLFKIYRATGDHRYASLLYDVIHAYAEGIQPNGKITERLTYCDADHRGSRLTGGKTGWNELNGALMALEIPGIYLLTDTGEMFVFDHIAAHVVERSDKSLIMSVNNPTSYAANVSVFAESYAESQVPLNCISFPDWKKISVEPGKTALFIVDRESKTISELTRE